MEVTTGKIPIIILKTTVLENVKGELLKASLEKMITFFKNFLKLAKLLALFFVVVSVFFSDPIIVNNLAD
ncbi:MAG: hypothetical protein WCX88_01645 [Patescibacteria group bacterium]